MKIINDIVETIWQAKAHRQVIFVSHNANLVVNGDAELVVCCDYRTTATESGGQIKLAGAIDVPVQSVCPAVSISHSQLPTNPDVTAIVLQAISAAPLRSPTSADCR